MRTLYRGLVYLHPTAFRRQFGAEMEWIFDETVRDESGRPLKLVADVLISLARQWILRSKLWIFALAALGGVIPFVLGFEIISRTTGFMGGPIRHRHLVRPAVEALNQDATAPFLLLTAVITVMFISGTMIFAITWFRYSQRRRRP
jgi:hypothetical protein